MKPLFLTAALSLLAPAAHAQTSAPYFPKFARPQLRAEPLFDSCTKLVWPRASLRNEETGVVTLRFTIAPNGRLLKQDVVRSTGFPLLDKAASEGLSTCRFRPGSINGTPVQTVSYVQYVWTLE
jgi:protein TonB